MKYNQKMPLYASFLLILLTACTMENVDLLVHNSKIYTVDNEFAVDEAMVVRDGIVVETGNSDELKRKYRPSNVLDANGKTIIPGLTDAHCHFWGYANNLNHANLNNAKSFDEIIELLKVHQSKYPSLWISGRGWDQNKWVNKDFPTNEKLEAAFPGKAIVLTRVDGHAVLASNKAIELSGINTNDFPDEMIIKLAGSPTGVFLEAAGDIIKQAVPKPSKTEMMNLLKQAEQNCFEVGLTKVYDAGLGIDEVSLLKEMYGKGELSIGIDVWLNPEEKNIALIKQGPQLKGDLTISAVKLYADGALGSRGACLLKPYNDKNTSGVIVEKPDFFRKWCRLAFENNLQVATHCIGDSANRLILDIYSEFLKGENDRRWRIEHAQVVHPSDVEKYGKFTIHPSIQPTHCTSDMFWADERLGQRIENAYIYKTLLDQNGWLAAGSDFPVEDINPLYGFYAAVSRKNKNGLPQGGFQTEQALTRHQALRAMTIWASKSNFTDGYAGSLEAGKQADFVILGEDILTVDEAKLFSVKVRSTYKRGNLVYQQHR